MKQFETRFKQVDVLPMVRHYMTSLDLYNLFKKYVPASNSCLAEHTESLCIITANIICDNKPLYKVQEWLAKYAEGLTNEPVNADADGHVPLSYKAYNGNQDDDTTPIPNWNELRALIHKEDFIYIADCKLCSSKNLAYIDENNGYFITIIPKSHKESKSFMEHIKSHDVKWEDAFEIQHL